MEFVFIELHTNLFLTKLVIALYAKCTSFKTKMEESVHYTLVHFTIFGKYTLKCKVYKLSMVVLMMKVTPYNVIRSDEVTKKA